MTRSGIEPRSPRTLANTLLVRPMALYIYIYIKLATIVENDLKAPFSIATTPRCRSGDYSIQCISPRYPYKSEC